MAQSVKNNFNEDELIKSVINDMFSNRWDECETTLQKCKNSSPKLSFCNVMFRITKSTLLLDDLQLQKAIEEVEACQKLCRDDTGILMSTVKSFISFVYTPTETASSLYDRLLKDIIIADCKLFSAFLIILRKERATSLFHGMLELRRAWKLYSSLQKRLFNSYKALEPRAEQLYGSDPNKLPEIADSNDNDDDDEDEFCDASETISDDNNSREVLNLEEVKALLASVSFGYGMMQLCFSFLPNRLMKLVSLLGFEGDRGAAMKAIYFTSHNNDMRTPLADILLLCYSILGPQLLGNSEIEMYLDTKEINHILERNLKKHPTSCLFFYFKSKFHQIILKENDNASKYIELSHLYSKQVREFKTITWFEMGILSLIKLDFVKALDCFENFVKDSKWSYAFNVYVIVLVKGCLNLTETLKSDVERAINVNFRRNFIEKFSRHRLNYLNQLNEINKSTCELLIIEIIYLMMFLPYSNKQNFNSFLEILSTKTDPKYRAVKCVLEGAIYFGLNENELAVKKSLESIEANKIENLASISRYTQPYAHSQLCCHYIDNYKLDLALNHLNMAKTFTEFEFRSRLQIQLRTIERRLNYRLKNGVVEEETYL